VNLAYGNLEGNKIALKETDEIGNETGAFEGIIKGTSIAGTWKSMQKKSELSFQVKN
jgi:hypothetical protein